METWKQQGIPLHIVLRGVERSFESYESRLLKRTTKKLVYCQEEVEAQYAEWLQARVGASGQNDAIHADADKPQFSMPAINGHLQRCNSELVRLSQSRTVDAL